MSASISVYHWTTAKKAEQILEDGLRQWSFVCREQDGWDGEVCLVIEGLDVSWENRDPPADWQAITHEHVPPKRIRVLARE